MISDAIALQVKVFPRKIIRKKKRKSKRKKIRKRRKVRNRKEIDSHSTSYQFLNGNGKENAAENEKEI